VCCADLHSSSSSCGKEDVAEVAEVVVVVVVEEEEDEDEEEDDDDEEAEGDAELSLANDPFYDLQDVASPELLHTMYSRVLSSTKIKMSWTIGSQRRV
jgi:hypothetical protein